MCPAQDNAQLACVAVIISIMRGGRRKNEKWGGEGIVRRRGKEKGGEEQPEMGWNFHDGI